MTTYNTGNPVPSTNAKDFVDNVENLDTAVNSTEETWTDRLGVERPTIAGLEAQYPNAAADAERAETAADSAEEDAQAAEAAKSGAETAESNAATSASSAATSETNAATSASDAQTYADAAANAGGIYDDTTDGLAGTSEGDYFYVPSAEDGELLILYLHDTGSVATEIGRTLSSDYAERYGLSVSPPIGRTNGMMDSDGYAASYVERGSGVTHFASVQTPVFNGAPAPLVIRRALSGASPQYAFDTIHIDNVGQSLFQRATGGWHYFVEPIPSAFGWPRADDSPDQVDRSALVSTDGDITGTDAWGYTGDFPTMAFFDFLRQLMIEEDGVYPEDRAIEMVTANNGYGSAPIGSFIKGTTYYDQWIGQVTAQETMDAGKDRRMWVPCSHWGEGESEYEQPNADTTAYRDILYQIAVDKAADVAAQFPDQPLPHRMLTYQTTARPPGASRYGVPRAIYQLCADYPELFTMTTPFHFLDYSSDSTGIHVTSKSTAWFGAYGGLAFKRQYIDRVAWDVPTVSGTETVGNTLYVTYGPGRMAGPWVIDTDTIAAQPNYGWTAVDDAGADKTITDVWLCGDGHTIAIKSDSPWVAGSEARYMQSPAVNMGTYEGGAGNIRDTQGDHLVYHRINKPLHNWLPLHTVTV